MAAHFLDEFVQDLVQSGEEPGELGMIGRPWYNPHGDCIEFLTESTAFIAHRVDSFLTIYRHHETEKAIGFQVKGVRALIQHLPIDGLEVEAEVHDGGVKRISLYALLLTAFKQEKDGDARRIQGYAEALKAKQHEDDSVEIPTAA